MLLFNYICLGFAVNGLSVPFSYAYGDDFTEAVLIRTIIENGWIGVNNHLGAPFYMTFYDFQAFFLMNFENFIVFIISRFIKDPFTIFNIQYLFTFALCSVTAFIVLRCLKVKRVFSSIGALMFGMSPCIYMRAMGHYCLAACYFVPLSILLCVWALENDEEYLSLKNGIKSFLGCKKNLAMVLCSFLVANNGIGYYPFFTCFFLCVTALITLFYTKRFVSLKKSVIPICCIVFFMLLALAPVFIYKFSVGGNAVARRSILDLELYGLKVTQLFMPTNIHHLPIVNKLVDLYNSQAPLVTENKCSYLGVFACVGLMLICVFSFVPKTKENNSPVVFLLPKLTLWALLFFSIGGFITLICLVTCFRAVRAFNRVSVFIEFMGIATTCYCMQTLLELSFFNSRRLLRNCVLFLLILFSFFCIYEQHPSIRQNNDARAFYKGMRENDKIFVNQIESLLKENDMVFQLPYHKFPEAGPVRKMSDYALFTGYINSTKLRWSYGGMQGRVSDKWNEKVSSLEMSKMIPIIVQSGFRGIYIDSQAYAVEELQELCTSIESVLINEKPLVGGNSQLYFYNLYPYFEEHPELHGLPIFDVQNFSIELGEHICFYGLHNNSKVYVIKGLSSAEESFTWTEGKTLVLNAKLESFEVSRSVCAVIDCNVFTGKQRVNISINGAQSKELVAQDGQYLKFDFIPPADGKLSVEIDFPDAVSPKQLGVSEDPRQLALALKTIVFIQGE